mgnify:CR=1 FL=1
MTEGYHKIKDDNILRGMELFSSAYRLLALLPIAKKVTQKILIFENGLTFVGDGNEGMFAFEKQMRV